MDYIYAKFHQNLTTLLVEAYYGELHASLQDWVLSINLLQKRLFSETLDIQGIKQRFSKIKEICDFCFIKSKSKMSSVKSNENIHKK